MDLIDRDTLKEAIRLAITIPVDCSYDLGYNDMVINAVKIADSIPTVDAQPVKHGRWIDTIVRGCHSIYCSECGTNNETICPSYFCPNCGAKMDGGDADANS